EQRAAERGRNGGDEEVSSNLAAQGSEQGHEERRENRDDRAPQLEFYDQNDDDDDENEEMEGDDEALANAPEQPVENPSRDHATMWRIRYDELVQYKEEFGDCLVPQRYERNPELGTWVRTQRRHYKLMIEGRPSSM
ncbi:hypothetical protein ACHAXS_000481, partial [Conticribra weissflogii]